MRLTVRVAAALLFFVGLSAQSLHAQGSVSEDVGNQKPCKQTQDGCPEDKAEVPHYNQGAERAETMRRADQALAARDAGFTEDQVAALDTPNLESLAKGGHVLAQVELAGRELQQYEGDRNGQYSDQELASAARWYSLAAKQGNAKAEAGLATMMVEGELLDDQYRPLPPDPAKAATYFQSAVDQGFAPAAIGLADLYSAGNGVAQNFALALRFINLAIELAGKSDDHSTSAAAYERLSHAYTKGLGVAKSPAKAAQYKQKSVVEKAKVASVGQKPGSNSAAARH